MTPFCSKFDSPLDSFKGGPQLTHLALFSEARRIAPILNPSNQAQWIEKAKALKQVELEKAVNLVNPKAHPRERIKPVTHNVSELRVVIDDETDRALSLLNEILSQKLGKPATLAEVIRWAAKTTSEKFDPAKKAERSKKSSSGNTKQPEPGRHPIPAHVKHEVVRRQGMRCSFTSPDHRQCAQRRWLHLHHVIPVSQGGLNHPDNLRFLCSQHHQIVHERRS